MAEISSICPDRTPPHCDRQTYNERNTASTVPRQNRSRCELQTDNNINIYSFTDLAFGLNIFRQQHLPHFPSLQNFAAFSCLIVAFHKLLEVDFKSVTWAWNDFVAHFRVRLRPNLQILLASYAYTVCAWGQRQRVHRRMFSRGGPRSGIGRHGTRQEVVNQSCSPGGASGQRQKCTRPAACHRLSRDWIQITHRIWGLNRPNVSAVSNFSY